MRGNRCRDKGVLYSHVLVIDFPDTRFFFLYYYHHYYHLLFILLLCVSDLTHINCHLMLSFNLVENDS